MPALFHARVADGRQRASHQRPHDDIRRYRSSAGIHFPSRRRTYSMPIMAAKEGVTPLLTIDEALRA